MAVTRREKALTPDEWKHIRETARENAVRLRKRDPEYRTGVVASLLGAAAIALAAGGTMAFGYNFATAGASTINVGGAASCGAFLFALIWRLIMADHHRWVVEIEIDPLKERVQIRTQVVHEDQSITYGDEVENELLKRLSLAVVQKGLREVSARKLQDFGVITDRNSRSQVGKVMTLLERHRWLDGNIINTNGVASLRAATSPTPLRQE